MSLLTPAAGQPTMWNVPVSLYGVVGAMSPAWSAAVAVTSLNVDPGVYWPSMTLLFSAPDAASAAPISGAVDPCEVECSHHMEVSRIAQKPRTTKPYTRAQWAAIDQLGRAVDRSIDAGNGLAGKSAVRSHRKGVLQGCAAVGRQAHRAAALRCTGGIKHGAVNLAHTCRGRLCKSGQKGKDQ